MASNIVPDTIDDAYPVAGEDNDSQGFRDNFNIIKTNFTYSKSEIEDLQDNTAKTNTDNVFFENTLSRYVSNQQSHSYVDGLSGVSADTELSFQGGHFFTVKAEGNIELTAADWPTNDEYAEIQIQIFGDGVSNRTVTFASTYSTGLSSTIRVEDTTEFGGAAQITVDTVTSKSQLVKMFTYDNGVNVFMQHLGTYISI